MSKAFFAWSELKRRFLIEILHIVFPRRKEEIKIPKLTVIEMAVESPAPVIPILKTKINSASPAMFKIAPEERPIIPKNAFPSNLRMLFKVKLDARKGAVARMKIP